MAAVVTARFEERQTGHAEALMPMIRDVMAEAKATFAGLDRIVVTAGPGTFTGVRVGVAAGRAIALVNRTPVAGISSLQLLAAQARHTLSAEPLDGHVLAVVVDARRGQFYAQMFAGDGSRFGHPRLLSADAAALMHPELHMVAVGSGAAAVADAGKLHGREVRALLPRLQPDARFLPAVFCGPAQPAWPLQPLYLRPPDAKSQTGKSLPHAPSR